MTTTTKPVLSLCVICGDDHVRLLPRMIRSIIDRSGGPAADEIVIGWNGSDDVGLQESLREISGDVVDLPPTLGSSVAWEHDGVLYRVIRQKWTGNFSVARQETFEAASGIWRGYIDADDELALPGDPLLASAPGAPVGVTDEPAAPATRLQDYLSTRRAAVNLILSPYYFKMSGTRQPLSITRRQRIVKWDSHWAWTGRVHEELRHTLGREVPVWNAGFLLIHSPVLSDVDRSSRNFKIVQSAIEDGVSVASMPPAMVGGTAAELMDQGMYEMAIKEYEALIPSAGPEERLYFWGMSAAASLAMGDAAAAGQKALAMIGIAPDRPEGYFVAAEAAAQLKQWYYVVRWYEAGGKNPVPITSMVDDRFNRVFRPGYSVAPAYLQLDRPQDALVVAEKALALVEDPFIRAIWRQAKAEIRERTLQDQVSTLVKTLERTGFAGLALRTLETLKPVLSSAMEDEATDLRLRLKREAPVIPAGTILGDWLREGRQALLTPIDSMIDVEDHEDFVECLSDGDEVRLAAVTVSGTAGDNQLPPQRVLSITAEDALDLAEGLGDVRDLRLVEETNGARGLAINVKVKKPSIPWRPDVTFFAPMHAEPWGPWRLSEEGTGGSEESVIYLAAELAARGLRVQVIAPLDHKHAGVHVEHGVRWRPLAGAFSYAREVPGIVVSCRAPNAVKMPCFVPERMYVWHQDAGYAPGTWSAALARATGHIFVSQWQKRVLASQVGVSVEELPRTVVAPDGIPQSALFIDGQDDTRDPLSCVYLSSPTRGLEPLLDVWPQIRQAHPGSMLHVYYGWHTAPPAVIHQNKARIMGKLMRSEGVAWHDRVSQSELEKILPTFGVWLYPMIFPEAYCIAGVRAAAAGLVPAYIGAAAMPETQYPGEWTVPEGSWPDVQDQFVDAAKRAISDSVMGGADRKAIRDWAAGRTWKQSADLILSQFAVDGLL